MATTATALGWSPDPRRLARLVGGETAGDLAGLVVTGRELGRRLDERRRTAFPTGLGALDELLAAGGAEPAGLPRGRLVELVGRASSGRFAAALAAVAAATRAGEAAALVDLGDHLDPEALAAAGADPDRLLWTRPRDVGEALAAAEAIVTGGLPLVVVDLGLPPLRGGRGAEAAWLRLARAADAHGAALLVAAPYRVTGTAAHAVVAAEAATGLYAAPPGAPGPALLQGLALRLTLEKLRGHPPGATATAELVLPQAHPDGGLVPSRRQAVPTAVVHVFPGTVEKNDERGGREARSRRGAPVTGAAGAAAGKLGAGAAHQPSQGTPDRAPAERRREPPPIPHFASAGSRPQPPPRPAATPADLHAS